MDINRLNPVPISPSAREKVILDFFPTLSTEGDLYTYDKEITNRELPLHAGALCLYATTLITKLHETSPQALEPYYEERFESYKKLIKSSPKHANLTNEQVETFAQNLINRDIRNCFAHGNFEISYDIYTKKLNYVLTPKRKDFITPEPIVISKQSLLKANQNFIYELGRKYSCYNEQMLQFEVDHNLSKSLKSFMLPIQMLKLSEYYLANKQPNKNTVLFDEKLYHLIQYSLLASKMTYDQNDYYNIFGLDSNVFSAIALIRNSLAHDNYEFVDIAQKIRYNDEDKTLEESVGESASKLLIVDSQKEILKNLIKQNRSQASIDNLTEKFKEMFDFFFGGKYDFKDIVDVMNEYQETPNEKE